MYNSFKRPANKKIQFIKKTIAIALVATAVVMGFMAVPSDYKTQANSWLSENILPVAAANTLKFDERTIKITSQIDMRMAKQVIQTLLDLDSQKVAPINLIIDSPGGSVFAGRKIVDMIKLVKSPVIAHVVGLSASMAAIITVHCDEIYVIPSAIFLFHNALISNEFMDIREAKANLEFWLKYMEEVNASTAERLGMTAAEYKDRIAVTWMLTAQEAIEMGFVKGYITDYYCKKSMDGCEEKLYGGELFRIIFGK